MKIIDTKEKPIDDVWEKLLDRRFIGIEKDDKYFEIAKQRIYETLVVKG
jgi:hypothetical protein